MRLSKQQSDAWHRSHYYYTTASGQIRSQPIAAVDAIHLLDARGHVMCQRSVSASSKYSWHWEDTTCAACVKRAVYSPEAISMGQCVDEEAKR